MPCSRSLLQSGAAVLFLALAAGPAIGAGPPPQQDPITPEMRAALGRINKIHQGLTQKEIDEAVEALHWQIASQAPEIFVPLAIPHLLRLVPKDKPILRLQAAQPLQSFRKGQPLVFEGLAAVPIHRPGPEHFKITRVSDGKAIYVPVDYDREQVEIRRPNQERGVRARKDVLGYNTLFKGTRLFLFNGTFDVKDPMGKAGILDLYGCPELEAGVAYRLTWACWPVGAKQAVEVSCEFELNR